MYIAPVKTKLEARSTSAYIYSWTLDPMRKLDCTFQMVPHQCSYLWDVRVRQFWPCNGPIKAEKWQVMHSPNNILDLNTGLFLSSQKINVMIVERCSTTPVCGHYLQGQYIPYSGKFSRVQIFCRLAREPSEEIFAVVIFAFQCQEKPHLPQALHVKYWCVGVSPSQV